MKLLFDVVGDAGLLMFGFIGCMFIVELIKELKNGNN